MGKLNLQLVAILFPVIMSGVAEAQALFKTPKDETPAQKKKRQSEKKGHVMNLVALTVAGVNAAATKPVLDVSEANLAADHLIEGVVAASKVKIKPIHV